MHVIIEQTVGPNLKFEGERLATAGKSAGGKRYTVLELYMTNRKKIVFVTYHKGGAQEDFVQATKFSSWLELKEAIESPDPAIRWSPLMKKLIVAAVARDEDARIILEESL